VDDNNKAFPGVICTLRGGGEVGWGEGEGEVPFHMGSRLHYSL